MHKINKIFILLVLIVIAVFVTLWRINTISYGPLTMEDNPTRNLIVTIATSEEEYQIGEPIVLTDEEGDANEAETQNSDLEAVFSKEGDIFEGKFITEYGDYFDENKPAEITQYFQRNNGEKFKIANRKLFPAGKNTKIFGEVVGDKINIYNFQIGEERNLNSALGEQKTLIILVYDEESYPDNLPDPQEIYLSVFGKENSVNSYMREASYGKMWYNGSVTYWYPISKYIEPGALVSVDNQQNPHILFNGNSFSYTGGVVEVTDVHYVFTDPHRYVEMIFTPNNSSQSINITLSEFESEVYTINGEEFLISLDMMKPPQQYIVEKAMFSSDPDFNFNLYQRLFIVWVGPMSLGGLGSTPQTYNTQDGTVDLSYAIVRMPSSISTLVSTARHELGHSMGLSHANYWYCGNESIGENCTSKEYLNWRDTMGQSYLEGHYNSIFKEFLNWFENNEIISSPDYGIYELVPLSSTNLGGTRMIKIPLRNNLNYYIEFRRLIGYDQEFSNQYGVELNDGAILLYDFQGETSFSHIIDSTPSDIQLGENPDEFFENSRDVVLKKGETFLDSDNNVALTTYQVTDESLMISYSPKKKSVIVNLENSDVSGYLNLKVQKYVGDVWIDIAMPVENEFLTIPRKGVLSLNEILQSARWVPKDIGRYKIIAEFKVPINGAISRIDTNYGTFYSLNDLSEFKVYDCGDGICQEGESCIEDNQACGNNICTTSVCINGCEEIPLNRGDTSNECHDNFGCTEGECICNGEGTCVSSIKYRAFITSTKHNGNFGGIDRADNICQNLAEEAGLGGIWKAWLSEDGNNSASQRFKHSIYPYILLNDTIIADNWGDLIDGDLRAKINLNEREEIVQDSFVFTGTNEDGSSNELNCENWASSLGSGRIGFNSWINNGLWTSLSDGLCYGEFRLYCFEQLV